MTSFQQTSGARRKSMKSASPTVAARRCEISLRQKSIEGEIRAEQNSGEIAVVCFENRRVKKDKRRVISRRILCRGNDGDCRREEIRCFSCFI